jgi:hypothetical protein
VDSAQAESLAAMRAWPGVEVCAVGEAVWLRAECLDEPRQEACRRLPGADRFTVLDDGQLLPISALVPRGHLPPGPWQPLVAWLKVVLPPALATAPAPPRVRLTLVRCGEEREPSWLLTDLESWARYAATAPQVRLARLAFAANGQGQVIVRGSPLPPLAGQRLVEQAGIAVPSGWTWTPAVDATVVRDVFLLAAGDSALWLADGSWFKIGSSDWVQATRSAARLSLEEQQRVSR